MSRREPVEDPELHAARRALQKHVPIEDIPSSEDLLDASSLQAKLDSLWPAPFSLLAVGDIMLGGRARKVIGANRPDYPFAAVLPLLRKSSVILGNLEGPFAAKAKKLPRTYSYRVNPRLASSLAHAGFGVLNLANNHLLDCGHEGLLETLDTLAGAGIAALGAGLDEAAAHAPVIRQVGRLRIGLLGYYWNRRCAATATLPGSAMDGAEQLAADIGALRPKVDRVVVMHHWGVPYVREPSPADCAKARFAIDCGADVVIGHHPHIVQPLEIYRDRPIFYSVGNFFMGSGNSRAEGIAVGIQFEQDHTAVAVFPLYVKNRDPRCAYQTKVMIGKSADRVFQQLRHELSKQGDWRVLVLPYAR